MSSRTRPAEVIVLPLSDGDTLTVKKHLTAGETRKIFRGMYAPGTLDVDPVRVGPSKIAGYLIDWTFTDHDGKPLVVLEQPEDKVIAMIDALDPESYKETLAAIEAHDDAMVQLRTDEKKARTGPVLSAAI